MPHRFLRRTAHRFPALPSLSWPGAAGYAVEALVAAAFVIAVYETVVGGTVRLWPDVSDNLVLLLWITAAAICGVGMKSVRAWARHQLAHRWPSIAAEPYTALVSFVTEAAAAKPAEDALPRLATLIAQSTTAHRVEVWLAHEHRLVRAATHPTPEQAATPVPDLDALRARPDIRHVLPVTDAGELFGALALGTADSAKLTARDLRLATDTAHAAGLLLRNLDLHARLRERIRQESEQAEALRVSRRRVVIARDTAREQLGREIQAVVCEPLERCALELDALRHASTAAAACLRPELAGMARRVDTVIGQFRRIVHGVHPSVLTDHGLVPALGNLLADLELQAELETPELPRLPAPIEATGYFCVAAVLRAWPHSRDKAPIRVTVAADGELAMTISDPLSRTGADPVDPLVVEAVLDRIAALDGHLEQTAGPAGLTVMITLPLTAKPAHRERPSNRDDHTRPTKAPSPYRRTAVGSYTPGIDRLFNRALTYALLLTLTGVAYVVGVVRIDAVFGFSEDWLAPPQLVASGLVALALAPVRRPLETWADRLVYGRRTPRYEVLAEVSALSQITGPASQVLSSLARITAEGLAVPSTVVHVDLPDGSHAAYRWPQDAEPPADGYQMPVQHGGARVGTIVLPERTRRDLAPDRRRLLDDLARSVGVILHNAGLTAELQARLEAIEAQSAQIRASRWRIVAAQDTERRELERDLHDGVQPNLTAVRLVLGLLVHLTATGNRDAMEQGFDQAKEGITDALNGLRRTLSGLDPQVLAGQGLGPALREHAKALSCPVRLQIGPELSGVRFDPAVESAVYYCCAEALQNTAKHAPGVPATISLVLDPTRGRLCFTVTDEGPGFAAEGTGQGAGLQNMADRASTVGGALELYSEAGSGTRITAWVPDVRTPAPSSLAHACTAGSQPEIHSAASRSWTVS